MSVYRTAKGKPIDMSTLAATYEKTRAVGNMGVNARGDVLDAHNRVIKGGSTRINHSYNKTVVVEDKPVIATNREPLLPDSPEIDLSELTDEERQFEQDDDEESEK